MALLLFKWLLPVLFLHNSDRIAHPIYISVTEIEHNAKTSAIEISCKIFTDDFEQGLRLANKQKIDLLDPARKNDMLPLVEKYLQSHLSVIVDGKKVPLQFLGYERDEEGITSYLEGTNVSAASKISVHNNILYEYKQEQMGIIHMIVNGKRKSSKIHNPDPVVDFNF